MPSGEWDDGRSHGLARRGRALTSVPPAVTNGARTRPLRSSLRVAALLLATACGASARPTVPTPVADGATVVPGAFPTEAVAAGFRLQAEDGCGHVQDDTTCGPVAHPRTPAMFERIEVGVEPLSVAANERIDVYGVVLTGVVDLVVDGEPARSLAAWHGFHAPGAGVTMSSSSGGSLILATATSGEPVVAAMAAPTVWGERPAPVVTFDFADQSDLAWAAGKLHARLGIEHGRASFGLLWGSADATVPPHRHPSSWEVIALLSAEGEFRSAADESAETLQPSRVASGSQLAVPPAHQHGFTAAGKTALFAVQMYVPPGPEQRFKQLSAEAGTAGD